MLVSTWTGGGTDYGGCVGRHPGFNSDTNHSVLDANQAYQQPTPPNINGIYVNGASNDTGTKRWGIFGQINQSTTFAGIRDGLSVTIAIGEVQRVPTTYSPYSHDGWAIGGDATGFSTGVYALNGNTVPTGGKLENNLCFPSPGSEHNSGANFGMADGSVKFLSDTMDYSTFCLLGSMADAVPGIDPGGGSGG